MIRRLLYQAITCFFIFNSCYCFVLPNSSIIKLKPVNNALISFNNNNRNLITSIKLKKNNIDFDDYKIKLLLFFLMLQLLKDIDKFNIY